MTNQFWRRLIELERRQLRAARVQTEISSRARAVQQAIQGNSSSPFANYFNSSVTPAPDTTYPWNFCTLKVTGSWSSSIAPRVYNSLGTVFFFPPSAYVVGVSDALAYLNNRTITLTRESGTCETTPSQVSGKWSNYLSTNIALTRNGGTASYGNGLCAIGAAVDLYWDYTVSTVSIRSTLSQTTPGSYPAWGSSPNAIGLGCFGFTSNPNATPVQDQIGVGFSVAPTTTIPWVTGLFTAPGNITVGAKLRLVDWNNSSTNSPIMTEYDASLKYEWS